MHEIERVQLPFEMEKWMIFMSNFTDIEDIRLVMTSFIDYNKTKVLYIIYNCV